MVGQCLKNYQFFNFKITNFSINFKWAKDTLKINEEIIKNYNENSEKGYILEADVKYPKKLHDLHSDLPFLPKRMKIDKCKIVVCNLHNKKIRRTYKFIKTSIKSWIKIKKHSQNYRI